MSVHHAYVLLAVATCRLRSQSTLLHLHIHLKVSILISEYHEIIFLPQASGIINALKYNIL